MATLACDYYTEVGVREKLVALGKAGSGNVEAALFGTTFDPKTLMRLPRENRPGDAGGLCNGLAMFTFPHGVRLVTHDEAMANAIPVVTSFVLTAEDKSEAPSSSPDSLLLAKLSLLFSKLSLSSSPDVPSTLQTPPPLSRSRMYCACIVWYEELPRAVSLAFLEQLELAPKDGTGASLPTVHAPEAICLLSRVPVFEGLMECCRQLFRMRLQSGDAGIPEKLLEPLLTTRLPGFDSCCSIPLGNVVVPFCIPAANLLPHTMAGRDFFLLLQSLDVGNLLMLWGLVLTEAKVLLHLYPYPYPNPNPNPDPPPPPNPNLNLNPNPNPITPTLTLTLTRSCCRRGSRTC